ncbi:MAG: hypothetical protein KKA42_01305, partial [candidate division Zixibacteria bacterium]|nr:hypothetical protein [candidate division Zixibacteria bacterium]
MKRMTGLLALSVLLMSLTGAAFSADDSTVTGWQKSLIADLTTTQTAYSDSWSGGEAGSFNWVGNVNGGAENQLAEWLDVKSTLRMSFG